MATFSNIGLEEASTITNRAATVQINRGGTVEDQEILVIGDPESSAAIARVSSATPAANDHGLIVREAEPTTTVQVSSVGGAVIVRSTAAEALVTAYQTTQADLRATIYQSTAAELNVTVAGYVAPSTTVQVSSLGGQVSVVPITSSGLELTTNTAPASTAEGIITRDVHALSRVDANNETTSTLAGDAVFTGVATDVEGFSNIAVSLFADEGSASSGMTFQFGPDATNWDDIYRFTMSSGSRRFQFPVTAKYFRVVYTNGSTSQNAFRVQTILHPSNINHSVHRLLDEVNEDRSAFLVKAGIIAQKDGSTDVFTPILATAGGNLKVSVEESKASTTVQVSSLGGAVITRSSAANSLHTVYQSTAADLNVTVAGYVAPTTIVTVSSLSAFAAALVSSGDPVIGQQGLLVEQNPINTTYVSGTLSSAESTVVAAISTSAFCVFGLTLSVPPTSSQTVRVVAASTNEKYRVFYHSTAVSAGSVDNVTPPGYLFKTAANQSLAITSSGGTANVTYTMKYYEEG